LKWTLRHYVKPGDIGQLTYLHGTIYATEYHYDTRFEAYVASGIADFIQSFKPRKDRVWLAETKHVLIGSIAIIGRSELDAQLRWFFVHPDYRGHGIGKKLIAQAIRFSKRAGYKTIYLWTTSQLATARHLYLHCGFKKTEEKKHRIWGQNIREERYSLQL
jgi:GNAT superfamily N-acetyltransferase